MEGQVDYQFDQEKYVNVYMYPPNNHNENMQGGYFCKLNEGYADYQIGDGNAIADEDNFTTENQEYLSFEEVCEGDDYGNAQHKTRKNNVEKIEYVTPLPYDTYPNEIGDYQRPDPANYAKAKYAKDLRSSKLAPLAERESVIRRYNDYSENRDSNRESHAKQSQDQYVPPLTLEELQGSFRKSYQLDKRKSQAAAGNNKSSVPETGFKTYNKKLLHLFSDLASLREKYVLNRSSANNETNKSHENKANSQIRPNDTVARNCGRSFTYDAIAERITPKRKSEIEIKYQNNDFEITYEEKKDENEDPCKSQEIASPIEIPRPKQTKIPKPVTPRAQPLSSSTAHNINKKYSYCEKTRGPSVTIFGTKKYQRANIEKNVNEISQIRPDAVDKSDENALDVVKSDMIGKFLKEIRDFHLHNISQEVKRIQYLEFLPKKFFKN